MLFDTLVQNGKSYDTAINMVMEKCDEAFEKYIAIYEAESAKEAYAAYMTEGFVLSKRQEDYLFDNTEATPGIVGRIIRILQEGWENLIRWIKSVINRIRMVFTKKQVEKKLSLIEKMCIKFPRLKNARIEVPDPNPTFLEKIQNDFNMLKIKIKTGKSFAEIRRDAEDIKKRQEMVQNAKKVATITITVAAALVLLKQYLDFRKMEGNIVDVQKVARDAAKVALDGDSDELRSNFDINKIRMKMELQKHFNIFKFLKTAPRKIFEVRNGMKALDDGERIQTAILDATGLGLTPGQEYRQGKLSSNKQTNALADAMAQMAKNDSSSNEDDDDDDYDEDDIDLSDAPEGAPVDAN